jgi:protein disulfide-isomerase
MMKKIALIVMISLFFLPFLTQAADDGLKWFTTLEEGKAEAAKSNKPIFLFFTGSDWCGWCIKLVKQVLSQPAFIEYADDLVLVKLDYTKKTPVTQERMTYIRTLMQQYGAQGFPTIILLNAKGETLGQTGYQDLSPEDYVKHLKAFIK